jgi:hypothetical protein
MIRAFLPAVVLAATLAGCAPRPEQPVLSAFFNAARLRDRTALRALATASFDPATDGMITTFTITGVVSTRAGDAVIERVLISAPVKLMSGQTVRKNLIVTLEENTSPPPAGAGRPRWIVTSITDAAAPSTPRS